MASRRFAGAQTALQPIGDVTEDLKKALANLKQAGQPEFDYEQYPSINERHRVTGTNSSIHLSARPEPLAFNVDDEITDKVYGNQQEIRELAKNPPKVIYNMAWDVDGSYQENDAVGDRKQKLRIAREAQRRWSSAIKKLPEGALVSNSPVGAMQGDFGRADVYMANGFGPVQQDGQQYGIVRKGRVEPLSPFIPHSDHVLHLAKKSRMAGDVDVATALEIANASNQKFDSGYHVGLGQAKGYQGYDDYDDYDNDYEPPLTRSDVERLVDDRKSDRYGRRGGVPEIELRQALEDDVYHSPGGIAFDVEPEDIQRVRDAQLAALQEDAPMRAVADALQSVAPRPLPQRIEADNYQRSRFNAGNSFIDTHGNRIFVNSAHDLQRVAPEFRREAAIDLVRNEIDRRVGGRNTFNRDVGARDDLKDAMLEGELPETNGPMIIRELYDTEDVSSLRVLQEALARNGQLSGNENFGTRRRGRRGYQGTGRGKSGDVTETPYGEQIINAPSPNREDAALLQTLREALDQGIAIDPELFEAAEGAAARSFERMGGSPVAGTVHQLDDPRLQRPRIPAREMQLRNQQAEDARYEAERRESGYGGYSSAPDNMSIDQFRRWRNGQAAQGQRQQPMPNAGRDVLVDLMDEGLLQPQAAEPRAFQMALERGEVQGRRRRPQGRGGLFGENTSSTERRREPVPDLFYPREIPGAPRVEVEGNNVYGEPSRYMAPAPMRDQLANLEAISEALQTPPERMPVNYSIDGTPLMRAGDIVRYLGVDDLDEVMAFRNRYGAASPVMVGEQFDSPIAAEAARRAQEQAREQPTDTSSGRRRRAAPAPNPQTFNRRAARNRQSPWANAPLVEDDLLDTDVPLF